MRASVSLCTTVIYSTTENSSLILWTTIIAQMLSVGGEGERDGWNKAGYKVSKPWDQQQFGVNRFNLASTVTSLWKCAFSDPPAQQQYSLWFNQFYRSTTRTGSGLASVSSIPRLHACMTTATLEARSPTLVHHSGTVSSSAVQLSIFSVNLARYFSTTRRSRSLRYASNTHTHMYTHILRPQ